LVGNDKRERICVEISRAVQHAHDANQKRPQVRSFEQQDGTFEFEWEEQIEIASNQLKMQRLTSLEISL
jgi:hypothetical protein